MDPLAPVTQSNAAEAPTVNFSRGRPLWDEIWMSNAQLLQADTPIQREYFTSSVLVPKTTLLGDGTTTLSAYCASRGIPSEEVTPVGLRAMTSFATFESSSASGVRPRSEISLRSDQSLDMSNGVQETRFIWPHPSSLATQARDVTVIRTSQRTRQRMNSWRAQICDVSTPVPADLALECSPARLPRHEEVDNISVRQRCDLVGAHDKTRRRTTSLHRPRASIEHSLPKSELNLSEDHSSNSMNRSALSYSGCTSHRLPRSKPGQYRQASLFPARTYTSKIQRLLGEDVRTSLSLSSEGLVSELSPIVDRVGLTASSRGPPIPMQVLPSPLPKLQRSGNPQHDIDRHLTLPQYTQIYRYKSARGQTNISFSDVGSPGGRAVLLIPGLGFTRYISSFVDSSAKVLGLRIITIDRPGQGRSEPLPRFASHNYAKIAREILQSLGIHKFSVVAHSVAAAYALGLILKDDEFINFPVVLLSPFLPRNVLRAGLEGKNNNSKLSVFERSTQPRCWCVPQRSDVRFRPLKPASLSQWSSKWPANQASRLETRCADALWQVSTFPTDPDQDLAILLHQAIVSDLPNVHGTFRIIHSECDQKVPIEYARALHRLLPRSELIVRQDLGKGAHEDIMSTPAIMAEVLESIARDLQGC